MSKLIHHVWIYCEYDGKSWMQLDKTYHSQEKAEEYAKMRNDLLTPAMLSIYENDEMHWWTSTGVLEDE